MARSFANIRTVAMEPAPRLYSGRVDAHEALFGIGCHFRTSWESFPRLDQPYLMVDGGHARALRGRVSADGHTVVGLSRVSQNKVFGRAKSVRLHDFMPLLSLQNFRFVDLQYGDTASERTAIEKDVGVRIDRLPDIDNTRDIGGLTALITACEVVLTISNTTAHLAGALGKPTWVMVPNGHARFWYWFRGDGDSPWYPRVRVRRQKAGQSWAELVREVTREIRDFVAQQPSARSGEAG
jgi:hypothetical protein